MLIARYQTVTFYDCNCRNRNSENILGKKENDSNKHCLFFPLCFLPFLDQSPCFDYVKLVPKQQILDSSKLKEFADDNFKFHENDRVLQIGRKHCGKR